MLVMIATAGIIYMILMPKKAIFEIINIIAQGILLYFIRIIHQYRIEISNENYVLQVEIALTLFLVIYAGYFLLKNIEDIITQTKTKKKLSKNVFDKYKQAEIKRRKQEKEEQIEKEPKKKGKHMI